MQRALIDPEYFNYHRYRTFIENRSEKMQDRITKRFGLSEKDFEAEDVRE